MKILVVEDDYQQFETIQNELRTAFPRASIDCIDTELDFRSSIDKLSLSPPDIILMDIMLRWTNPSPKIEKPPPEIATEGYHRAGFRCRGLLDAQETTRRIPVVLYTVLGKEDIESELSRVPPNVVHIQKDTDLAPLVDQIRIAVES